MTKEEKLLQFDQIMRAKFGVKWAPPAPSPAPEPERKPAAEPVKPERTKPNRRENEFMMNMMVLRNTLMANGPAVKERAKRAGKYTWRDIRLMTRLVEKVQNAMLATMPKERDGYYMSYAQHGHYELMMNGPIRNTRMVLISDRSLGAVCEAAVTSECAMCMREGSEIGQCLLRKALLEVAPPTEIQDGRWRKCEYRDLAGQLLREESIEI